MKQWVRAVKHQESNWDGSSLSSFLCSKHFKLECFVTDGIRFHEEMGILGQKCLKADAVLTIFARSVDYIEASSCNYPYCQPKITQEMEATISKNEIHTYNKN